MCWSTKQGNTTKHHRNHCLSLHSILFYKYLYFNTTYFLSPIVSRILSFDIAEHCGACAIFWKTVYYINVVEKQPQNGIVRFYVVSKCCIYFRTSHSHFTILAYPSIESLEGVYIWLWNRTHREWLHYTQYKPKHWYYLLNYICSKNI